MIDHARPDGVHAVREGGLASTAATRPRRPLLRPPRRGADRHGLRHRLGRLLAAEERGRHGTCLRRAPVGSAVPAAGDTILLATAASTPGCGAFYRTIDLNGVATWVPNRALVLVFDASNWNLDQTVWVTAVDDQRAEGAARRDDQPQRHRRPTRRRRFDDAAVRNVEVHGAGQRRTPGSSSPRSTPPATPTTQTIVIEGTAVTRARPTATRLVARQGAGGRQASSRCSSTLGRRPARLSRQRSTPRFDWSTASITFTAARRLGRPPCASCVAGRRRLRRPGSADRRAQHTVVVDADRLDARRGLRVRRSSCSASTSTTTTARTSSSSSPAAAPSLVAQAAPTDDYDIRLTQQPTAPVTVAVLTDGQADVVAIDGVPVTPAGDRRRAAGAAVPRQRRRSTATTITRAAGSEFGNFNREASPSAS